MSRAARIAATCLALVLAGPGGAADTAPDRSVRPVARGQVASGLVLPAEIFIQRDIAAEVARQVLSGPRDPAQARTLGVTRGLPASDVAPRLALRPRLRPAAVLQQGRRVAALRRQGAVCGDLALQGVAIGRVASDTAGCGVEGAVRLQSVSGVALSTHAVMDCGTAQALKTWVETGLRPAVKRYGGGVSELRVVAHYACRPRNNRKGARISEHGKGRAVDIAAIRLNDGKDLVVLDAWGSGRAGRILKAAHASACGPFGTVLGPEANALHRDHFHFDTARYRSGSYCR